MRVLDAILMVLLLVGNLLALPIWWWLLATPIVACWRRCRGLKQRADAAQRLKAPIIVLCLPVLVLLAPASDWFPAAAA